MAPPSPPTNNQTSSQSRAVSAAKTQWQSFKIHWAKPGVKDLESVTDTPMVTLNPSEKMDIKPYLNEFSLAPGEDLNAPRELPKQDRLLEVKNGKVQEYFAMGKYDLRPKIEVARDNTYTDNIRQAEQKFKARKLKFAMTSKGVLCTKVVQWVMVDVDVESASVPAPSLHLWAFLQPARIGGNKNPFACDSEQVPDDFPRSGWAEYKLDGAANKATEVLWDKGGSSESPVSSENWVCQRLAAPLRGAGATWRFKVKVVVRNQKTAGDVERENKFKQTKIPEKDFEAGCWLKVWVRDAKAGYTKPPMDDESDAVMKSMDAQLHRGNGFDFPTGTGPYQIGGHGFLRSRMLDATNGESADKASPAYVLLFTETSMADLVALDAMLKDKGAGAGEIAAATGATSAAALLIGFAARKILEKWKKQGVGSVPADQSKEMDREKAQFLIELLESYQVANHLAAYAADGFQHVSPSKAADEAGSKQPELYEILAHLYGQVFDFCLVDGPTHYKEYAEQRLEKRQQALETQIKWSKDHNDRVAAQQASEKQRKALRHKEMAAQLNGMGLGLGNRAKKRAEDKEKAKGLKAGVKPTLALDAVALEAMLLEGSTKWAFPKPVGAPLPIPGIPLVWRVDIEIGGEVGAKLKIAAPATETASWEFGIEFTGKGWLKIAAGIHALWSSMAGMLPDGSDKQKDLKDEFERNKKDLAKLRKQALTAASDPKTELVRVLHSLMKYVSLDIAVNLALNVDALVGFKLSFNHQTGAISHQWVGINGKPTRAGADMSLDAHVQISVVTLDYNLAGMPRLARANPELLTLDFSGQVLGKPWPAKPMKIEWGSGRIDQTIERNDSTDFLVWGRPKVFSLGYKEIKKPDLQFELVRTAATSAKLITELPGDAAECKDAGNGGACEVTLQLSCQKTAGGAVLTAGSWALAEQVKVLGGGHDFGPKTEAGQLIHDILHSGNPQVVLRGSYMESMYCFSQSLKVTTPRLTANPSVRWVEDSAHRSPAQLQVVVGLGYFEDSHIWMQLIDDQKNVVKSAQGDEWQCLRIMDVQRTASGISGFLLPRFKDHAFRGKAIGIKLSLVPSELGVMKA